MKLIAFAKKLGNTDSVISVEKRIWQKWHLYKSLIGLDGFSLFNT